MLSKDEAAFIKYWEANRLKRKKLFRQFLVGIPLGLLIVIPTVISLTSGWYKRAEMEANSTDFNPMVLFIALLVIVGFTAIFHQRWKWEQYEQRYLELLAREERFPGNATELPDNPESPSDPAPHATLNSPTDPVPHAAPDASTDPESHAAPDLPTNPTPHATPDSPKVPDSPANLNAPATPVTPGTPDQNT
ncbi:MAG: hypothetical protein JST42_31185 [Bacteroidetes bacterium]|nr:hypothetical protein [Bacteroidota bacterium]